MRNALHFLSILFAFLLTAFSSWAQQYGEGYSYTQIDADHASFVIGQGGKFMAITDTWPGHPGRNGWTSFDVNTDNDDEPRMVLVSSPNVWEANDGSQGVSASDFPVAIRLTNLQTVIGPNIRLYNGWIIDRIEVKLKNKYAAVTDDSSSEYYTTSISLSIGVNSSGERNTVTASNSGTAIPTGSAGVSNGGNITTFSASNNDFDGYSRLPVVVNRGAVAGFSRDTNPDGSPADLYAYAYIKVYVKRVTQSVRYTVYFQQFDNEGKLVDERPLSKKDAGWNTSTYTADDAKTHTDANDLESITAHPNRYFSRVVTNYVGQNPEIPGELRRMGCEYGYNKSFIEETGDGSDFYVRVYYSVLESELPFFYSSNTDNPEYKYYLSSKQLYDNGKALYQAKNNNLGAITNTAIAATVAFVGDPYNTLWCMPDATFTNNMDANKCYRYNANYQYWDICLVRESSSSDVETNYFAMKDHTSETIPNYNYLGVTSTKSDGTHGFVRTRVYGGASATAQMSYFVTDNEGVFYFDYFNTTTTSSWQPKGFMLALTERDPFIRLNYYVKDENGKSVKLYDPQGVETDVYVIDAYNGDRIVLPKKYIRDYFSYEYYIYNDGAAYNGSEADCFTGAGWTKLTDPAVVSDLWTEGNVKYIYVKCFWDNTNSPVQLSEADTPFNLSTDKEEHWYYLKLNGRLLSAAGRYPYRAQDISGANAANARISPLHLWKFVRNTDVGTQSNTLRIINRWYGDSYVLSNISGDYAGDEVSYESYSGPSMELITDALDDGNNISMYWEAVKVNENVFGLRSLSKGMAKTMMNICDLDAEGLMRYWKNPAQLEGYSRIEAIPYEEGTLSDVASPVNLSPYITRTTTGQPYGFPLTGPVYGMTLEDQLVDPRNYIKDLNGYFRIRTTLADEPPVYLVVRAILAPDDAAYKDVITHDKIRARLNIPADADLATLQSFSDRADRELWLNNHPGTIFNFVPSAGSGDSPRRFNGLVRAQGFAINSAIAVPAKVAKTHIFDACTSTVYPYGLGEVVVVADKSNVTGYEGGADMLLSYKDPMGRTGAEEVKSLIQESPYLVPSPFYLEAVDYYTLKMTKINTGDPNSYGCINLPFDIELPADIIPYRATAVYEEEKRVELAEASLIERTEGNTTYSRVLPAETPVVLIKPNTSVSGTEDIPVHIIGPTRTAWNSDALPAANKANVFSSTLYNFQVPKPCAEFTEEQHSLIRCFGSAGGKMAGFWPFKTHKNYRVPANKAYIDIAGEDSSASASTSAARIADHLGLSFTDESIATLRISGSQYATYYNSRAVQLPADVEAAVVVSADANLLSIDWRYAGGDVLPGGTAVILRGPADSQFACETAPADPAEPAPTDNLLRGSDVQTTTTGDGLHYKFSNDDAGEAGFFFGAPDGAPFISGAHKAWLVVPNELAARSYLIGVSTGISTPTTVAAERLYDLSGRPVPRHCTRGIYITTDGRKVVLK